MQTEYVLDPEGLDRMIERGFITPEQGGLLTEPSEPRGIGAWASMIMVSAFICFIGTVIVISMV